MTDTKELFFKQKTVSKFLPNFKSEKTQQYTTLALTLFILCVFGIFAIRPTLTTIAQLQKEISDNTLVLNQLETKNQNLDSLTTEYANLQFDIPVVIAAIPKSPNSSYLVGQLQRLGENNGVKIDTVIINTVSIVPLIQVPNTASNYSFTINAHGPREYLDTYVKSLLTLDRILTIDSLSYSQLVTDSSNSSTSTTVNPNDNYSLIISGKAYYEE